MNENLPLEPDLQLQIEQLASHDWRLASEAEHALARAGEAGFAAALQALSHPHPRVRRGAAGFMDHHGTDACLVPLREVAFHDPVPSVRRVAVHSASCQRCKPCPLTGDLTGFLIQVALSDPHWRVRAEAVCNLRRLPRDARAIAALEQLLRTETDPRVHSMAHHSLKYQDPAYRARVDAEARARGIAAAQARQQAQDK